jgi:hypothetical protein
VSNAVKWVKQMADNAVGETGLQACPETVKRRMLLGYITLMQADVAEFGDFACLKSEAVTIWRKSGASCFMHDELQLLSV